MDERFDNLLREEQSPADRLALARQLLRPRPVRDPAWPALAAAGLFAASAMAFAVSAVLAPPSQVSPLPDRIAER